MIFGARRGIPAALIVSAAVLTLRMLDAPPTGTPFALIMAFAVVMSGVAFLTGTVVAMVGSALQSRSLISEQLTESETRNHIIERIAMVGSTLNAGGDARDSLDRSIEQLTIALGLDVFIVRRNIEIEGELHSEIETWTCHPDHPESEMHRAGTWAWSELPGMREKLESGDPFVFSSFDEVSEPDRLRLSRERSTLPAVLNIPITSHHGWLGHVALGCARPGMAWTAEDIASLRILADMVANAWDHQRHTSELIDAIVAKDRSIAIQTALTNGTRLLLGNVEGDAVARTLGSLMDALDGDVAWVEHFEEDPIRGWISVPAQHLYRYPERAAASETWQLTDAPMAARALLSGVPYIFRTLEEEQADPQRSEPYDEPLHAECNIPIQIADSVVGFVGVGCYEARDWTGSDIDVLTSLARMLGAFFEREQRMQELEDLVTAKDRFIAAVSHELRTPLSVVVGLAAEMEDNQQSFSAVEQTEFLGMIRRQSREVADIIDDLLVSARISETALTVIESPFNLDDLIRDVLEDLPPTLTAKIAEVDLIRAPVLADPLRTRQVVRNLITNAERYGGDQVFIAISVGPDVTELHVSDDGDGVPESKRQSIFEAYNTTGAERTVTAAIGLGLTVSRQLAQLMGGDVEYVHSNRPSFLLSLRSNQAAAGVDATESLFRT
jgi:signal transduction histidine kinase